MYGDIELLERTVDWWLMLADLKYSCWYGECKHNATSFSGPLRSGWTICWSAQPAGGHAQGTHGWIQAPRKNQNIFVNRWDLTQLMFRSVWYWHATNWGGGAVVWVRSSHVESLRSVWSWSAEIFDSQTHTHTHRQTEFPCFYEGWPLWKQPNDIKTINSRLFSSRT